MYRIGLDIGIKSVGWSVLDCNDKGEPIGILMLGSRIFDAAEQPKTGASLAMPRRLARGNRRRLRRKSARLSYIRKLFEKNGIFIFDESETQIKSALRDMDVLAKRAEALDSRITEEEFARVLYSIARYRGFKSNRKSGASAEDGALISAIAGNKQKIEEKGYRTVGEYLFKEYENKGLPVHNRGDRYDMCIARDDLKEEIEILFKVQKKLGNGIASDEIKNDYMNYFTAQRTFDEGPGIGSPYSGKLPVRKCTFYPNLDCVAKGSYSNELSTAYQKINHLSIINGGERSSLTQAQRESIISRAHEKEKVTYKDVRKLLKIREDDRFAGLNYSVGMKKKKDGTVTETDPLKCEDATFISLKNSNAIRKVILSDEARNDVKLIDEIAEVCTRYTNERLFRDAISKSSVIADRLSENEISELLKLDMKGYGHLSNKALNAILPYLANGDVYSEACKKAGFDHSKFDTEKGIFLGKSSIVRDKIEEVTSPVVKRALAQTIKVIDAIIRKFGSPYAINVELARDMSQKKEDRDKTAKESQERALANEKIKTRLQVDFGVNANSATVMKYKLFEEQNEKCIYSGEPISLDRLLHDEKYCEIDHILPYSRSFDDSFNNKVLVLSKENQNKRNDIPYDYFKRIGRNWSEFETRVKATYQKSNNKKMEYLLKKNFDEEGWKNRALNDTRYASRMLFELIKDHLIFDEKAKKRSVMTVNGRITSYLRRFWGIPKFREDGDKHHAIDATIIACVTDGVTQKLTHYNYAKEARRVKDGKYLMPDGEIVGSEYYDRNGNFVLPYPYANFIEELRARTLEDEVEMQAALRRIGIDESIAASAFPFTVSRMPHRKANGAIHEATVWSSKYVNNSNENLCKGESVIVKRTPLEKLRLDKTGEIAGYFNPSSDRLLYAAIKQRLIEHGGDGKKAFAEPLYKPCKSGQGNEVHTVKTFEKYYGGGVKLEKNQGIVANGSMIRVDLYSKNGKYFGVPVYVSDLYKGVLPNRAATPNKPRKDWRVMDDSYTFEMSVYPNDLLKIESDKGIKMRKMIVSERSDKPSEKLLNEGYFYYSAFNISSASVTLEDPTGCYFSSGVGIQKLKRIIKCEIDVLGNVKEITRKPNAPMPLKRKSR